VTKYEFDMHQYFGCKSRLMISLFFLIWSSCRLLSDSKTCCLFCGVRLKLDLKDVSRRSKPGGGDGDESGTGVESGASTTRLVAPPCSPTGLELSPASGPSGGSDDRSDAETARELVAATSYAKLGPEEDISFSNTPRSPPPQRAASPADENDRALIDALCYKIAKDQVITEAYDEVKAMLKRMNNRPEKLEDACEFSWPMPWFSFQGISRDNPLR
jgi:hypothetical protein